jgi:hypothetical protein
LRENELLPSVISVPQTSLKSLKKYLLQLASHRVQYPHIITLFKLNKTTSTSGIEYSEIVFTRGALIPKDKQTGLDAYKAALVPALEAAAAEYTEAAPADPFDKSE